MLLSKEKEEPGRRTQDATESRPSGALKLVVQNGPRKGLSVDFAVGATLTIGSSRQSGLHLKDPAVAWGHARLSWENDAVFLEDLGSPRGTLVNGERVDRGPLYPNDVLTIGHTEVAFEGETIPIDESAVAAELGAAHEELEGLRAELTAATAARDEALAALDGAVAARDEAIAERDGVFDKSKATEAERETERKETQRLREALGRVKKEHDQAAGKLDRAQKKRDTLGDELHQMRKARESAEARLAHAEEERLQLCGELNLAQEKHVALRQQHAATLQLRRRDREKRRSAEQRALATEAGATGAQNEVARLSAELDSSRRRGSALEDRLCEVDRERERLGQQLAALDGKVGELQSRVEKADTRAVELEASVKSEREETQRLTVEVQLQRAQLDRANADLKEAQNDLNTTRESAESSRQDALEEIERQRASVTLLERELSLLTSRETDHVAESRRLQQQLDEVLNHREQLVEQLTEASADNELLTAQGQEADLQIESLRETVVRLETEHAQRIVDLQGEWGGKVTEISAELDAASVRNSLQVSQLERSCAELAIERDQLNERAREADERIQLLIEEREVLRAQLSQEEHRLLDLKDSHAQVNSRLGVMEAASRASDERYAELREALEERDAQFAALEEHSDRQSQQRIGLEAMSIELLHETEELRERASCWDVERASVRKQYVDLTNELDRVRQRLQENESVYRSELDDLRGREESAGARTTSLRVDLERLRGQHAEDLLALETLRASSTQLETEVVILRGQLEELKGVVEEKRQSLRAEKERSRRRSGEEAARILREKRKLEALVRGTFSSEGLSDRRASDSSTANASAVTPP